MPEHCIFGPPFSKVHLLFVQRAQKKNRTREEVDQVICWPTGYDAAGRKDLAPAGGPDSPELSNI